MGLNKVNDEGFKRIFDGLLKKKTSKLETLHLNFRYTDINNDTKDILKEFFASPAGIALQDINLHLSETLIDPKVETEIEGLLEGFDCSKKMFNQKVIK